MYWVTALLRRKSMQFSSSASVVAARARGGSFAAYDPPKNEHENHILRRSTVPSPLPAAKLDEATAIAMRIAEKLDYVGVLGVELFVGRDGALIVNEIAPRVHNSGHWTEAVGITDQFEQHIRAIAGWPLGDPTRLADVIMRNLIGPEITAIPSRLGPGLRPHAYGKTEARAGRKMGHLNRVEVKTPPK